MPASRRWHAAIEAALWLWAAKTAWDAARFFLGTRARFHVESAAMILVAACLAWVFASPKRSPPPPPPQAAAPTPRWLPALLMLGALLLYWPALDLGLLSDDFVLIERARSGAGLRASPGEFYRPLALFLLAGLGSWPWLLHLLNVLLHGLNAVLVHRLALAVGASAPAAVAAGLLFLCFPAGVEAVAWIAGIQDVLLTTAALAFVLAWGLPRPWPARLALSLVALLAGLATKETAVALPLLGLTTWLAAGRLQPRDLGRLALASLAVTGAWAVVRLSSAGLVEGYGEPLSRFLAKEILVRSFGTVAAPWHAGLATQRLGLLSALLWPGLLVLAARGWRGDRASLARSLRMALWLLLSVAPVYDYLYISPELGGSRYLYLGAAGGALLLAELATLGLGRWLPLTAVQAGLAAAVLVGFGATRLHLVPWLAAARVRDQTLAEASLALDRLACGRPSFENLPDNVQGAYVFRNGFPEALERAGSLPVGSGQCRLAWDGERFTAR